jgi:hypothetical protein
MFSAIDRKKGDQRQLLMDDHDPQLFAVADIGEPAFFALVEDLAGERAMGIDAAQDLHQRAFPSAVLAHEGVNLPLSDAEIHIIQCFDARECLGDVAHFQNDVGHSFLLD